jgi:hypothetical protein
LDTCKDVFARFLADIVDDWHYLVTADHGIAHSIEATVLGNLLLGLVDHFDQ